MRQLVAQTTSCCGVYLVYNLNLNGDQMIKAILEGSMAMIFVIGTCFGLSTMSCTNQRLDEYHRQKIERLNELYDNVEGARESVAKSRKH